jgi:hypothetical protein
VKVLRAIVYEVYDPGEFPEEFLFFECLFSAA